MKSAKNAGKNEKNIETIGKAVEGLDKISTELAGGERDPGDDADIKNTKVQFELTEAKSSEIDPNGLYKYLIELFTGA